MDIHKLLSSAVGKTVIDSYKEEVHEIRSILIIVLENEAYFNFYCSWRIECSEKVLAANIVYEDGLAEQIVNVSTLIGRKILSYELSKQNDVILYFDNSFVVRIFCNAGFESNETKEDFCTLWDYRSLSLNMGVTIADSFQQIFVKFNSNDERML